MSLFLLQAICHALRLIKVYFIVCVVLLSVLLPSAAQGHETDQYSLPLGREFADLRFYFSRNIYDRIVMAVDKTNGRIKRSLSNSRNTTMTNKLQSPDVIAKAVWLEFPSLIYQTEAWELTFHSDEVRAQFPGLITAYKPVNWIYSHWGLILNPTKLVRLIRRSTFMINGTYLGTDKIAHFFDMGFIYYSTYRKAKRKGLDDSAATKQAVSLSTGGNVLYSESALLGSLTTGVRSNADLAANYVGLKFFQNLTESVRIQGKLQPPILVSDGVYWRTNDHVRPHSDFFTVFVSDHFNEALNPNTYTFGTGIFVRKQLQKRCDDVLEWYRDDQGNPRSKEQFQGIAEALSTYFGEDYGHAGVLNEMISIANDCFANDKSPEASLSSRTNNAAILKESDQNVSTQHLSVPLSMSIQSNPQTVKGADTIDSFGRNAIWWVARHGQIDNIRRLIAQGINIHQTDIDLETPLHSAVRWGNVAVIEILLAHGANANAVSLYGTTPLHLAARGHNSDVVRVLLKHGANINARDRFGCTPLHDIAARGDVKIASLLVVAGADLNSKDIHGTTPLHRAARAGNTKMVAKLASLGASPTIKNSLGMTPLDEAIQSHNKEMLRYLTPR